MRLGFLIKGQGDIDVAQYLRWYFQHRGVDNHTATQIRTLDF
jgi:hypothetical protein